MTEFNVGDRVISHHPEVLSEYRNISGTVCETLSPAYVYVDLDGNNNRKPLRFPTSTLVSLVEPRLAIQEDQLARAIFDARMRVEAGAVAEVPLGPLDERAHVAFNHVLQVMWDRTKKAERIEAEVQARSIWTLFTRPRP